MDAINHAKEQISSDIARFFVLLSQTPAGERAPLLAQWGAQNDISEVVHASNQASEADERKRASQLLLDSLYYEQMSDRQETVAKAHAATFRWVLDRKHAPEVPWTNFATWLLGSGRKEGPYWITGKPGSGKSTLMRFLLGDNRTRRCLRRWAKSDPLIVASCFFWHSGEPIQKSREGLLRSLLYQLFLQDLQLMEVACPWRWRSYVSGALNLKAWTNQQLFEALNLTLKALSARSKTCLFIDGLDEYEGDNAAHKDLVEFVKDLSRVPNVKLCVSSRPWVVFQSAFCQGPSLELHHLSHQDIENYTNQELVNTELFQKLKMKHPVSCSELEGEITEKAQGVFLWVFLVIRDLLECLRNGDGIGDLRRKLNSMPSDLHDFFTSMFKRLEDFYFEQACKLFQVAKTTEHPLSLLTYSYILEENDFDAVSMGLNFMPDSQVFERCEVMERRLNSRCRGLLEVTTPPRKYPDFRRRVDFLHRTVRDFFESRAFKELLQECAVRAQCSPFFDANRAIALSCLAQIKTIDFDPSHLQRSQYIIEEIFHCARRYEEYSTRSETLEDVLDNLEYYGAEIFEAGEHWIRLFDVSSSEDVVADGDTFITAALRRGLHKYCKNKLLKYPSMILDKPGRPLLDYVLRPNGIAHDGPFKLHIKTLDLLLKNGASPNEKWRNSTVWGYWVEFIAEYKEGEQCALLEHVRPTKLLIEYGAKNRVILPSTNTLESAHHMIMSAFGTKITHGLWGQNKRAKRQSLSSMLTHISKWRSKKASH